MSDKAIIFRSYDPIAVELAEASLRAAEIPFVRLGRAHAALLGVGELGLEQLIEVDHEHAETARELLAEIPPASVEEEEPGAERGPVRAAEGISLRAKIVLSAVVLIVLVLATGVLEALLQ